MFFKRTYSEKVNISFVQQKFAHVRKLRVITFERVKFSHSRMMFSYLKMYRKLFGVLAKISQIFRDVPRKSRETSTFSHVAWRVITSCICAFSTSARTRVVSVNRVAIRSGSEKLWFREFLTCSPHPHPLSCGFLRQSMNYTDSIRDSGLDGNTVSFLSRSCFQVLISLEVSIPPFVLWISNARRYLVSYYLEIFSS